MQETFPKPKFIFLWLRWCAIVWGMVEGVFSKFLPSQWEIGGGCQKTGECCKLIGLEVPSWVRPAWLRRGITRAAVWWSIHVNGFTYAGELNQGWLGFTCNRLAKDNTCLDYFNRPRICREYPQVRFYGKPNLAKGCGFKLSLKSQKIKLYRD